MADITLTRVADLAALGTSWRDLEQRADASFFQTWTWLGCLAEARFSDPILLQARADGRLVALALWNARPVWAGPARLAPWRLHLAETGDPQHDSVFIEHNAPLLETGREALLAPLLAAVLSTRLPGVPRLGRTLVLSGVGEAVRQAARSLPVRCRVHQSRPAPFIDLAALPQGDLAATLGTSTRYQLRRSAKRYATLGKLAVCRAVDVAQGLDFLDRLTALHQATWTARGKAGAFADPGVRHFHRTLIARGLPRGEIDLLHIAAGTHTIGYLYNVMSHPGAAQRWVGNYQGGFDYSVVDPHCKPGLTCHSLATAFYRAENRHIYDLLAGESRYKTSLTLQHNDLHWIELSSGRVLPGLIALGAVALRRLQALRKTQPGLAR